MALQCLVRVRQAKKRVFETRSRQNATLTLQCAARRRRDVKAVKEKRLRLGSSVVIQKFLRVKKAKGRVGRMRKVRIAPRVALPSRYTFVCNIGGASSIATSNVANAIPPLRRASLVPGEGGGCEASGLDEEKTGAGRIRNLQGEHIGGQNAAEGGEATARYK